MASPWGVVGPSLRPGGHPEAMFGTFCGTLQALVGDVLEFWAISHVLLDSLAYRPISLYTGF